MEALGELCKEAWREAYSSYKDKAKETKRKKGKPKKSDTASKKLNEAKQKATDIKISTYILLVRLLRTLLLTRQPDLK